VTRTTIQPVPHGDHRCYWRGCRRPECTRAATARNRLNEHLRQTGRGQTCPPDRAAKHITALREAGMADAEIENAARIHNRQLYEIVARRHSIRRATERRILAVAVRRLEVPANDSRVSGVGTSRRMQAMVAAGWPPVALAARLKIPQNHVCRLFRPDRRVALGTALKVRTLFAEAWAQKPEDHGVLPHMARRARNLAARNGWHPAAVWDNFDDPAEEAKYGEHVSRVQAIVEDTAELIREGLSPEGVEMRLAIKWESIRRAHLRAGVLVPEVAA
jgi:hypothetical protein